MTEVNYRELNAGLYARKSTEDKGKQVQSIGDQVGIMSKKATSLGIKLKKANIIKEEKSAKTPGNRPEFDRLIKRIRRGEIDAIICWQINRLSRNPAESGVLQQLLQDGLIKCIITNDKVYLPSDNAIIFSVEASMSNQYVRELMVNVRRGMYSRADKGWFPGVPPIGYVNFHDPLQGKIIIADPERWALVRKMWDWMLSGMYNASEIARKADKELGLKTVQRKQTGGMALSVAGVYAMFHNPFYRADFIYGGKLYHGNHPAMVTPEEFDRVQSLIAVSNRHRPTVMAEYDYFNVYRGLVECGECGYIITYARKVRHYKNGESQYFEYCYCTDRRKDYTCSNKQKIKPASMNKLIRDELKKYTIMDDFFQYACKYLNEWNDEQEADLEKLHKAQGKAIKAVETELYGLQRMLYTGRCSEAFFDAKSSKLERQLKDPQTSSTKQQERSRQARERARQFFNFARYAKEDFESDSDERKRAVLAGLNERLVYMDGQVFIKPIKYLQPVVDTKAAMEAELVRVGTLPQQMKKASYEALIQSWYTWQDSNLRPLAPQANALSS